MSPGPVRCPGSGSGVIDARVESRVEGVEGKKEYRCPECGRWLRVNFFRQLPFHKTG